MADIGWVLRARKVAMQGVGWLEGAAYKGGDKDGFNLVIKCCSKQGGKEDPPANADKDAKKRKRKDSDTSSSKKGKDQAKSSKKDKTPCESSANEKDMDDEELI
ncbi:hypothetical protein Tco_1490793 [Tanacetum coccineum]